MARLQRRDVIVEGCDDSTAISDLFTADEIATLERVATAITAESGGRCQPRMQVREHIHGDISGGTCDECPEDI